MTQFTHTEWQNDIEGLYKEALLELYRHPLNKKVLVDFDVQHREFNPTCGDDISLQIKFDEMGKIKDIGHQGQGCAISQAVISLLTDEIKGKTTGQIAAIGETDIYKLLGFTVVYTRKKCALLGLTVLKKALQTHE